MFETLTIAERNTIAYPVSPQPSDRVTGIEEQSQVGVHLM